MDILADAVHPSREEMDSIGLDVHHMV